MKALAEHQHQLRTRVEGRFTGHIQRLRSTDDLSPGRQGSGAVRMRARVIRTDIRHPDGGSLSESDANLIKATRNTPTCGRRRDLDGVQGGVGPQPG